MKSENLGCRLNQRREKSTICGRFEWKIRLQLSQASAIMIESLYFPVSIYKSKVFWAPLAYYYIIKFAGFCADQEFKYTIRMVKKRRISVVCYDTGIPIFFTIELQVISFLSLSGLCLHYQVYRFLYGSGFKVSISSPWPQNHNDLV